MGEGRLWNREEPDEIGATWKSCPDSHTVSGLVRRLSPALPGWTRLGGNTWKL